MSTDSFAAEAATLDLPGPFVLESGARLPCGTGRLPHLGPARRARRQRRARLPRPHRLGGRRSLVGSAARPGTGARPGARLRRLQQRARRLLRDDGPDVPAAGRAAVGGRLPRRERPRHRAGPGGARRGTRREAPAARDRRLARRHAGARVGAARSPSAWPAIAPLAIAARHSAWAIALSETQRQAIAADPRWRGGHYPAEDPPSAGLAAARMLAMCSYRSRDSLEARFGRERSGDGRFAVESWLHHHGRALVDRFDANSYVTLTRAMDTHDVGRGRGGWREALATVKAPALVLSIDSDVLYPPVEQEELASALPDARLVTLRSPHGHDAFLIEGEAVGTLVRDFRESLRERGREPGTRGGLVGGVKRRVLKFGGTSVGLGGAARRGARHRGAGARRGARRRGGLGALRRDRRARGGARRCGERRARRGSLRGARCATGTWRSSAPSPLAAPRRARRPRSSPGSRPSRSCCAQIARQGHATPAERASVLAVGRAALGPDRRGRTALARHRGARVFDAAALVRTDAAWSEAAVDFPATRRLVHAALGALPQGRAARGHRLHRRHRARRDDAARPRRLGLHGCRPRLGARGGARGDLVGRDGRDERRPAPRPERPHPAAALLRRGDSTRARGGEGAASPHARPARAGWHPALRREHARAGRGRHVDRWDAASGGRRRG